jgi:hypothetical protein
VTWRWRRRLAILALVLGLPAYVIVAVNVVALFERPGIWVELAVYVALGIVWVLPLRRLFLGIGRPDPAVRDDDPG